MINDIGGQHGGHTGIGSIAMFYVSICTFGFVECRERNNVTPETILLTITAVCGKQLTL